MENTANSAYRIRNDFKRFEKYRKKVVFLVQLFIDLNIQERISRLKPYFQVTLLLFHLNKICKSPKEIHFFLRLFF
jgi:hypothetical protein